MPIKVQDYFVWELSGLDDGLLSVNGSILCVCMFLVFFHPSDYQCCISLLKEYRRGNCKLLFTWEIGQVPLYERVFWMMCAWQLSTLGLSPVGCFIPGRSFLRHLGILQTLFFLCGALCQFPESLELSMGPYFLLILPDTCSCHAAALRIKEDILESAPRFLRQNLRIWKFILGIFSLNARD